jgi:hypothetical protein
VIHDELGQVEGPSLTQLDRGRQLDADVRVERRPAILILESLIDRAALLVSEQLERVCQRDASSLAFFSGNFAGTVSYLLARLRAGIGSSARRDFCAGITCRFLTHS